ncbi:MAG: oligosaccharide flippase family protein [Candidatus Omnitrophota bacterium]|nr:oligosaccharide flippase family protein [Candidatus Omnitrophota bacterium]
METSIERPVGIPTTSIQDVTGVHTAWWDYVSILAGQVAFAVLAAVTTVLTARLLGPEGYGTVALFLGMIQLFFVAGVKWSFPAAMRYGREALISQGAAGRVFWAWTALVTTLLVVSSCVLLSVSRVGASIVGLNGRLPAVFIAIFAVTVLTGAIVQLLQMQGNMKAASWSPVEGRIVYLVLLTGLAWLSGSRMTPLAVILCLGIAMVVQAAISLPRLDSSITQPRGIDWRFTRTLTRYSLALWLGFFAAYLCDWVDLYFLRFLQGRAEVGVYQIAFQVFLFIGSVLTGMHTLMFPVLTAWRAQGREDRVTRYLVRFVPQVTVLWGFVLLGLGIVAEPFFSLLMGPRFAISGQVLSILLVSLTFQPIISLYNPLFFSHDGPAWNTLYGVLMAVVKIVGDILLVPRFGAFGAAWATGASFAVFAWCALSWGNRRIGVESSTALIAASLVAGVLAFVSGAGQVVKLALLVSAALLLLGWTRASGIFSSDDLSLFDHVDCPPTLLSLVKRVYVTLSSAGASSRGHDGEC